jgi:hypothetical protein
MSEYLNNQNSYFKYGIFYYRFFLLNLYKFIYRLLGTLADSHWSGWLYNAMFTELHDVNVVPKILVKAVGWALPTLHIG